MHAEGGPPSARCPRDARSVHGDRGFDWNDVDFLLFGVTTEEILLLQSSWPVSRTFTRGGAGTFVSGRDANVVRETVIATAPALLPDVVPWTFVDILRLWASA